MPMFKFLIAATFVFVSVLIFGGMYHPGSLAMSLADTTTTFMLLRVVVCVLLIGLLFTNPPRSLAVRSIVGAGSVLLFIVNAHMVMNFQILLLDAVVFLEVAIIFGIEALETRKTIIPAGKKRPTVHKIPVYTN